MLSFVVAALSLSSTANAGIYVGNPTIVATAERPQQDYLIGTADLAGITIHHCDGTVDNYTVEDTIDPVKGFQFQIAGGDLCGAEFVWDSPIYLTGKTFTVKAAPETTYVDLGPMKPEPITDWAVVAGNMPSPTVGPDLVLTVLD